MAYLFGQLQLVNRNQILYVEYSVLHYIFFCPLTEFQHLKINNNIFKINK